MALNPSDPRTHITPESFGVASELLGLPLASPWRRAAAMVCDLIPLAILIGANVLVLAIAAAVAFWRASAPTSRGGVFRRGTRALLRVGAACLAFLVVLRMADRLFGDDDGDDDAVTVVAADPLVPANAALGLSTLLRIPDIARLEGIEDTAEARASAVRVAEWMADLQLSADARRQMTDELLGTIEDTEARAVAATVFAAASGPARDGAAADTSASSGGLPAGDALVIAYAAALADGDTTAARSLREPLTEHLAADRIADLEESIADLREDRAELRRELARAEEDGGGITGFIRSMADDLGIGFGWGALYFTSFLALWGGQTPGKWLMGVRVIRLDGRPLGWWRAFERFGGYAASLSTGLLGFFQILWDRNRQGLHDKAAETVVIRVRRATGKPASSITPRPESGAPHAPR